MSSCGAYLAVACDAIGPKSNGPGAFRHEPHALRSRYIKRRRYEFASARKPFSCVGKGFWGTIGRVVSPGRVQLGIESTETTPSSHGRTEETARRDSRDPRTAP